MPNKIVFIGSEAWGIPTLKTLLEEGYDLTVVTRPDAPAGRGRKLAVTPIKEVATSHRLAVWQPAKAGEIAQDIQNLAPGLGVVVAYGQIIPQAILDLFPHGILNLHPSALPKFRGPSPIEATILAGEQPAVSIIRLTAAMDAGDIAASQQLPVGPNPPTAPELYQIAGEMGAKLMCQAVRAVFDGSAVFSPQSQTEATFCQRITKADGVIDWHEPANLIERQVRAYLGWPGSRTTLFGRDVTITLARAIKTMSGPEAGTPYKTADGELAVATGQGCLIIDHLIPAGKREMTGRDFLAGHRL